MDIYSNNNLHFGMAYKMKGNAAKRVAEYIQGSCNSKETEEAFIKIANKLNELTTEVIADGNDVIVKNPTTKITYYIKEAPAWSKERNGKVISYPIEIRTSNGKSCYDNIDISYSDDQSKIGSAAWDSNFAYGGIFRKHIHALEIAKEFDKRAAIAATERAEELAKTKDIETTTNKLNSLFG